MILLLFKLLVAHALCDYPLQGDFLSRAKNRQIPAAPWYTALAAHALIQGGGTFFVTNSLTLGLAETAAHALIDYTKGRGRITFNQDQLLHVGCKLIWVFWLWVTYAA